jgi:hypothetical protein
MMDKRRGWFVIGICIILVVLAAQKAFTIEIVKRANSFIMPVIDRANDFITEQGWPIPMTGPLGVIGQAMIGGVIGLAIVGVCLFIDRRRQPSFR